jgi:hypothetical protein
MICEICKIEFRNRGKQKYCSDKCRREAWKQYLSKRYNEIKKKDIEKRIEEERNKPNYLHPEVKEFLIQLAKEQQFTSTYKLKDKCEACGSTENLLGHEVTYSPIKRITLCAKCHNYLHKNLLGGQRVKPRRIK